MKPLKTGPAMPLTISLKISLYATGTIKEESSMVLSLTSYQRAFGFGHLFTHWGATDNKKLAEWLTLLVGINLLE